MLEDDCIDIAGCGMDMGQKRFKIVLRRCAETEASTVKGRRGAARVPQAEDRSLATEIAESRLEFKHGPSCTMSKSACRQMD